MVRKIKLCTLRKRIEHCNLPVVRCFTWVNVIRTAGQVLALY
jgi:hypothetical protein